MQKEYKLLLIMMFLMLFSGCPGKPKEVIPENTTQSNPDADQNTPRNMQAFHATPTPIPPTVEPTKKPKEPNEISSYATALYDKNENRIHNIKIAADELDHTVIEPGEVFSFNETLGKRTAEKGYEKAPILEGNGKKGKGTGGGICQISSTLYNAAVAADMNIIERHRHSKSVPYVPEGKDATVVYGLKDFRFENTKDYPVEILISISEEEVTIRLFKKVVREKE